MFKKLGEISTLKIENMNSSTPSISSEVLEKFTKLAGDLNRVAPKANDFLYFSTVMMHAAEAAAINDDGTPKLTASGEEVKVGWDKSGDTWKWISNDPTIKSYKNSNGDIFPEEELVKAHKKWIGKPLCIDHKSSSVDHVRGFIVDTYYDLSLKRVVALCALDKKGFPQLARQVETGVSNNVSMGTAVGRAICYDCAKVARVESDFCDHMRRKSCYGEINVDLNPIELSIVVNGADPKASIKHIIAAAKTLNNYVDGKAYELNKIAEKAYTAVLTFADQEGAEGNVKTVSINSRSLENLKSDIDQVLLDYKELNSAIKEENFEVEASNTTNDFISDQLSGDKMSEKQEQNQIEKNEVDNSVQELRQIQASIETKIDMLTSNLNDLQNKLHNKQEETMSGKEMNKSAYYLGTEEPTPGQAKYTEDPKDAKVRADADDYTHGRLTRSDMGPVDGLFGDDLERKRLLARAQADERAALRAEAVKKASEALQSTAYYLNGDTKDNAGTPTPGKIKYEISKDDLKSKKDREEYELGKKSLLPYFKDDEAKKKLLNRASRLHARFVKAAKEDGTPDLGNSAWEVFVGDELIVSASVDELSGGKASENYDYIATAEGGKKIIEKIKSAGVDGFKSLLKKAQAAPMPAPEPAALPDMPAAPASPEAVEDSGKSGDPKETALALAEKVQDMVSDLLEAIRTLTGEQAEMGDLGADMTAQASAEGAYLDVRKELNSELIGAMKECVADLSASKEELSDVVDHLGLTNDTNRDAVESIASNTVSQAKEALAESYSVLRSFVRYVHGTQALEKKAQMAAELKMLSSDESDDLVDLHGEKMDAHDQELMNLINDTNDDLEAVKELASEDDLLEDPVSDEEFLASLEDHDLADVSVKKEELKDLGSLPAGSTVRVTAGLESKAARQAERAKLAAEMLKIDPVLYEAHPNGGTDVVVDKTNLGHVEDLVETHEVMLDVATSPVRLRKEAETLNGLIANGSIQENELDELVSQGLDKAVVDYWRKYFAGVEGSKEFVDLMVKEHTKAQMEEDLNQYKVKLARAYELTYDMVSRGLCNGTKEAIETQVGEVMKFNDDAFESLKNVIAMQEPRMQKSAGRMPQVGLLTHETRSEQTETNMRDVLARELGKSKGTF